MTTQSDILAAIGPAAACTVEEIAALVGEAPDAVQATLHAMDDAGQVIMRGGYYRQAEVVKCARK